MLAAAKFSMPPIQRLANRLPSGFLLRNSARNRYRCKSRPTKLSRSIAGLPDRTKTAFLRAIASNIEGIATEIIERAEDETALPKARLQGEVGRTCGQLRLFRAGGGGKVHGPHRGLTARTPDRKPAPKPDIRSMLRPLGPVVVFGASNFPLAFSVAGGDTASALAAGNPVIVKAHPAHPGTSEFVGQALRDAVRECNLPKGVFSLLFDQGNDVGTGLLKHPLVKAAAFTGSRHAGKILMGIAASRPEPIPFYAEMSSVESRIHSPRSSARHHAESIASGLHISFTLGAGYPNFAPSPAWFFCLKARMPPAFSRSCRNRLEGSAPLSFADWRNTIFLSFGARGS